MTTLLADNTPPYIPAPPSADEMIASTVERIRDLTKNIFEELLKAQKKGIDLVWNTPGLTPQQVIDGLGSDALKIFQFHGELTDFIKAIASIDGLDVQLKYPTNAFTVDETGAIIVSTDPYVIS